MKRILHLSLLCIFSINLYLPGMNNTWLSTTPPDSLLNKITTFGMSRLPCVYGKMGQANIIQWIRRGSLPGTSRYISETEVYNPEVFVFDPQCNRIDGELITNELGFIISYQGNGEGYFSIYLVEKYVRNDTLNIIVAKAERMSHSCGNGHDRVLVRVQPKIYSEIIPIEIVRQRFRGEDFHTVIQPGNDVAYKIIVDGKPLVGSKTQMATHKGWIKSSVTDANGEVSFQFIQDDNGKWKELRERVRYNYLFQFDQTVAQEGTYQEKPYNFVRYSATFPGSYRPSQMLYSSFVWALFLIVFAIIVITLAIYWYRRKNKIDYKEIAFNE